MKCTNCSNPVFIEDTLVHWFTVPVIKFEVWKWGKHAHELCLSCLTDDGQGEPGESSNEAYAAGVHYGREQQMEEMKYNEQDEIIPW